MCQISSKSLKPRPRYGVFEFFKMAAAAILDFLNFEFSTVGRVKNVDLRHRAKFPSKSFEQRPRYVSFNIILVWLENAYSRPFWGVLGVLNMVG